ncbi:glycosyltransferase family 4 protein [Syntrophomonas erecta]
MTILNLGTYPPKQCGIATFSWDLRESLLKQGLIVKAAAVSDQEYQYKYGPEVVLEIGQQDRNAYTRAARLINQWAHISTLVIQHEYGIYGGYDGEYILDLVSELKKPYLVVSHTVLPRPREHQRQVLHKLCSQAAGIVCMTKRSARLLHSNYDIAAEKIAVISHGVPDFKKQPADYLKAQHRLENHDIISTFGLIGPGKGLELGIEAMASVVPEFPNTTYLILGQTHPMLQKREGEKYREMLEKMVHDLGLDNHVKFINKFLPDQELGEYLYMTDIYLSPYPNPDQAVSGTMAFAVGCGRAIVSTSYAYALEILADNRGLLAEKADPHDLATLIKAVLADNELKTTLQRNALTIGKTMSWNKVGEKYRLLLNNLVKDYAMLEGEEHFRYARL